MSDASPWRRLCKSLWVGFETKSAKHGPMNNGMQLILKA
jgi:hypothetical protein